MSNIIQPGHVSAESRERQAAETTTTQLALSAIADDYRFFNHGALFAFAGFRDPDEDPLNDWYAGMPLGTTLLKQHFDRPVFRGIDAPSCDGRSTWNHVVCAVLRQSWPSLYEFLGGVVAVNRDTRAFYQTFSGDVSVPDPVLVDRRGAADAASHLPHVPVTVFCVDGNRHRWEIRPAASQRSLPCMIQTLPRPDIASLGELVLDGAIDKLSAADNPAHVAFFERYRRAIQDGPQITGARDGNRH